jgi:hypothetical protein
MVTGGGRDLAQAAPSAVGAKRTLRQRVFFRAGQPAAGRAPGPAGGREPYVVASPEGALPAGSGAGELGTSVR